MCHTQSLTCEPSNNAEASHNDKEDAFNKEFKVVNPPRRLRHLYQAINSGKHALLFNNHVTKLCPQYLPNHKRKSSFEEKSGRINSIFWLVFISCEPSMLRYELWSFCAVWQLLPQHQWVRDWEVYLPLEAHAEFGTSSLFISFKRKREHEPFSRGCLRGTFPIWGLSEASGNSQANISDRSSVCHQMPLPKYLQFLLFHSIQRYSALQCHNRHSRLQLKLTQHNSSN